MHDWHERLWQAESAGPGYRALSSLLAPAEWLYRLAVCTRNWGYERGVMRAAPSPLPALAVGNLTVGGTGKTPVTAWFAGELRRRGWRPAVVMRGYGGDEDQVHKVLNPDVPALVAADRLAGVRRAAAEGADVAVLDDAFQHRALRADAYVVLVAAEEWTERARLLPRGPWREPRAGLSRADLLVITRKTASRERAADVLASAAEWSPAVGRAQVFLKLAGLARYEMRGGALRELAPPRGLSCALAVAGVRSPETVFAQLESAGVRIAKRRSFPDHHRYRASEVAEIAAAAERGPVVTTLKDVVKLRAALPPEADVYVAVQRVEWELGSDAVERLLSDLAERGRGRVTRT